MRSYSPVALVLFLVFIGVGTAHSDIGITLSNTCLTQLKANNTTNCPTYEQLLGLYPDQSNREVSGEFGLYDGIYQRDTKKLNNHFEFYKYDNQDLIWIDPPADTFTQIQTITITSSDFVYTIKGQQITNSSFKYGQGRFIDNSCSHSIITAENWIFLLGDTIQHMLLSCDAGTTNFDEIKIREWQATKHDIATTYKWQLEQWIDDVKKNCLTEFMKCKDARHFKVELYDSMSISDGL